MTSGSWRRAAFRPAAKDERVRADLALVDDALLVAVEELDRVLDGHDVLFARGVDLVDDGGQRRRLARAGRARDEHEAARALGQLVHDGRQPELLDGLDRERDQAEGRPDRRALVVGVDTEASSSRNRIGEVDLPVGLKALALIVGQDRVDRLARLLGGHDGVVLQRLEASPDPYGWMGPGREMQVGGVALDDLEQQVGEVKAHYARLSAWHRVPQRLMRRRNGRPYDPRHGWLTLTRARPVGVTQPPRARLAGRRQARRAPAVARRGRARGRPSPTATSPTRGTGGMPRLPGSRRFWRFLLVLLILNIVFAQLIPSSEDQRLDVPYTFFRQQVTAGNVKEVNAKNDVIQGEFRQEVKFEKKGPETNFETVRPTFAQDDELLKLLLEKKVEVNARPIDEGRGFLATLLLSFGPTLLIVGLFIYFIRRSAAAAGGGALALGRSKAKRYDASATRVTLRGRRRHRRGRGRAQGDRRLPQEPRPLPQARRGVPQGRAAVRPAGHRQDAARARRRRRGRRAVLLAERLGVRRDGRRRRRVARARPLRPGQEGRARRSSSSTSSTRSAARAAAAAASAATTSASRRSTRSSPRWTASPARRASSCSRRRTAPRCSTPRCCAPGASTAA